MKFRKNRTWGILLFAILNLAVSCKSTKLVTDGTVNTKLSAKAVIKAHYQNTSHFKTLRGKVKLDYTDGEDQQSFTVSLRMEKDKAIWMSATMGIVKAYITPERVSFYNKLQNEYFDGDFSYLSKLLGAELNFNMLQNLLLGEAIVDLRDDKYDLSTANNGYELTPKTPGVLNKLLFMIEPRNFKMGMQQLSRPVEHRLLQIAYEQYQNVDKTVLPNKILVTAVDDTEENTITLEFRNLDLNQKVNFPYTIPKGFSEIVLK